MQGRWIEISKPLHVFFVPGVSDLCMEGSDRMNIFVGASGFIQGIELNELLTEVAFFETTLEVRRRLAQKRICWTTTYLKP